MADAAENQTVATEQIRSNTNRNQAISPSDPNSQISSLLHSTRCKPTISSLFLSNVSNMSSNASSSLKNKKKNFTSATFRGLGCVNSSQVSAPAAIRSSADWQAKKVRKNKQRIPRRKKNPTPVVVVVPDVCCATGIAVAAAADVASVDLAVSGRPVQGRERVHGGERVIRRERSCTARRIANLEQISVLDPPSSFETMNAVSDVYGARHHRHFRHRSPVGLAEIMMLQGSLLLGGRSDRYRDWRLDVDNMSYEELLELGDRIGYVNTGLREDEIFNCIRKTKLPILDTSSNYPTVFGWKCSICQEEYEADDDVGKLECGHNYHIYCIKQWLLQKNACPVCKLAAVVQN